MRLCRGGPEERCAETSWAIARRAAARGGEGAGCLHAGGEGRGGAKLSHVGDSDCVGRLRVREEGFARDIDEGGLRAGGGAMGMGL